jgi:hypothetical protein
MGSQGRTDQSIIDPESRIMVLVFKKPDINKILLTSRKIDNLEFITLRR